MNYHTTFEEVKLTASKSGKCEKCGKRLRRQKTFWQTLNPFNKKKDGVTIKTRDDIYKELRSMIDKWKNEPVEHDC